MRCPTGFCGAMSIFSSLRYCLGSPDDLAQLWLAMTFMPFGLFFDFMDGKVARWRKKSSLMGQELDSLADLVHSPPMLRFVSHGNFTDKCPDLFWNGPGFLRLRSWLSYVLGYHHPHAFRSLWPLTSRALQRDGSISPEGCCGKIQVL